MDRQIKNGRRMPSVCGSPSARLPHGDGGQPLVALKARLSPAGLLETAWLGGLASGSCSLVVPPSAALRAPPSRWAGTWLLRVLCKRGAWPHSPWRGPPLPGLGQHPGAGKYMFGFLLTALSLLGPWFVAQGLAVRGAPGPLWEGLPGLIWAVPCPLGGIAGFGGGWAGVGAGGLCRAPGAGRFTVLRAERQAALRLRCLPRMDVLTPPCELTSDPG